VLLFGLISTLLCLRTKRPEERARDERTASWWDSQNTMFIVLNKLHSCMNEVYRPQN
jgi:hypothetical protein